MPGLRRGEVAALAGVSIEYYSKLERGALAGVSASVLDAIARALQLDDAERAHLFHLAHAADGTSAGMRPRRRPTQDGGRRGPACSGCSTPSPRPGDRPQRPHGPARHQPPRPRHARLRSTTATPAGSPTSPASPSWTTTPHRFYPDWDTAADIASPSCAPKPAATRTTRTCTTSSANCPPAATTSAAAGAPTTSACHGAGTKHFHHHVVGDLDLAYESVDMVSDPGLTLTIYAAEPASPTAHALDLLASWAATTRTPDPTLNHLSRSWLALPGWSLASVVGGFGLPGASAASREGWGRNTWGQQARSERRQGQTSIKSRS